jgi:hypothetical protein
MFDLLRLWPGFLLRFLRSRQSLLIDNLALRQQLAVFKRQHSRPRLTPSDKIFWVLLRLSLDKMLCGRENQQLARFPQTSVLL